MKLASKFLSVFILLTMLCACAEDGRVTKKDVGMVVGGAAGGAAGAAIWGNNPSSAILGTILGVVVGAAAGGYLGSMWDDYDRKHAAYALEHNPANTPTQWKNPDTGRQYEFQPTRTYTEGNTPCREFTQTIYIDGRKETGKGTACRQPDGTWRINAMQ